MTVRIDYHIYFEDDETRWKVGNFMRALKKSGTNVFSEEVELAQ